MTILTDDEIMRVATTGNMGTIEFAQAIESAVLAKLEACEMPEPKLHGGITVNKQGKYKSTEDGYTADQLRQAVASARAKDSVDAERYWWIRQYLPSDDVGCNEAIVSALTPEEIDAAIDAAREVK